MRKALWEGIWGDVFRTVDGSVHLKAVWRFLETSAGEIGRTRPKQWMKCITKKWITRSHTTCLWWGQVQNPSTSKISVWVWYMFNITLHIKCVNSTENLGIFSPWPPLAFRDFSLHDKIMSLASAHQLIHPSYHYIPLLVWPPQRTGRTALWSLDRPDFPAAAAAALDASRAEGPVSPGNYGQKRTKIAKKKIATCQLSENMRYSMLKHFETMCMIVYVYVCIYIEI